MECLRTQQNNLRGKNGKIHLKKVIDRQLWAQVAPAPNAHAAAACLCQDMRNDFSRNPFTYQLVSATVLNRYNIVQKGWNFIQSPALAGTFGAGAAMVFAPSMGLKGVLAAGATTSKVIISTAFPAAVGVNMLANRGGSGEYGFKIRIVGKASGKIEERLIIGHTAGTTPTIDLSTPLTFTPALNDEYEILSGKVFMLSAGALAAGVWKSYETATNFLASALTTTNLPATIGTDTSLIALDEQYVPYDCTPGSGMVLGAFEYDADNGISRKALTATASAGSSLTGQATLGDAVIAANEFRNFQIRIVQDTGTPAAVGQRRIITSHTAGPSPVYTLSAAWTTTPSATANFVIEQPNLILGRSTATTSIYAYNYSDASYTNGTVTIASGAWSTAFAAAPAANAAGGVWAPSWGIQPDPSRNARHSFNYFFRGASATVDIFDLAGGTTGAWTTGAAIDGAVSLTTGTSACLAPYSQEGRFLYMNIYVSGAVNQMYRFDVKNRVLSPVTPTDFIQTGTAAVGNRMAAYAAVDGADKYDVVLLLSHLSTVSQELIVLV